ncbi:MAG: Type II/IV secretion system protein TadC, associated with Flp pilus assembly [Candidatus Ozemobacter sibiricus]|uniref:Type II/IV secretion system protein TadC, associated with Flp pilus assembly n=1 Tax=Candidatus Ozemobacter sibiricus TaxID=2268124 RepID=A0A367ZPB0_9BACT|nr:MAG: Type II/IV secretion system protein TadC, associated with Flp pilus assembly [Candidatus Ozemobacter sibiricus]
MEILFIGIGAFIVFLVILLLFPSGAPQNDIQNRLAQLDGEAGQLASGATLGPEELNKPFVDRIIRPLLARMAGKRDPKEIKRAQKSNIRKMLAQAGYPGGLTVGEFLVIQNLCLVIAPSVAVAFGVVLKWQPMQLVMGGIFGLIIGVLGPRMFLQRKIADRLHAVTKQLPDVLDLLTVAVEAGLGFDAACDKVVEKMRGPIPDEFSLTLRHIRMGQSRRDAFKDMADRLDHPDMSAFVSAIVQADQLGVSIGQVLRIQSDQLREKRRQRAEEEAAKAPVKMMIPLVFFIFPNVGIIIGAPAVFQILEAGQDMEGK